MPTQNARHRSHDPLDPDADLDRLSSDELEDTAFGPDPSRARRRAPRAPRQAAPRPTKFCHACAETLDARAEMCPSCGVRQPGGMRRGKAPRERTTAAVLALVAAVFFAGIGLHKFYLGRTGAGILSVLFVWTGIPWVVSIVNLIQYLTMDDEAFEERYA